MNSKIARVCRVVFLVLTAVWVFGMSLPAQRAVDHPSVMKIRVEDGRITADIMDTPLQAVLKELAERTGIVFEVRSQDNPQVSVHLSRVTPEEAIQRIASKSNVILIYGQGSDAGRVKMARIIPRTGPTTQPGLSYLGTGVVTKNNNNVDTPDQALQILQTDASIEDKQTGIRLLIKNRSDAGIKALTGCLSDPSPEIRAAAIEGLAAMEAHAALPEIVNCLKDPHPGVRQSAATAVSLLGNASNVKDLRPLSFDKDSGVASAAQMAIRKLSAGEKK